MTHYLRFAALTSVIAACGVATALAAQTIAPTMARTDQSASVEADAASPALTAAIRQALARARPNAAADPQESGLVTTLADIIVTADVAPVQALASVRLAIAEERCVFENSDWNRWGCAGLASVAASIERAIGSGPAATVGEGGVATPPPPSTPGGGGADYRSPVGG